MSVRVEVVCISGDGDEQRQQVLTIERQELAMETLGLSLNEGKALLAGVQDFVVAQQVHNDLERRRVCPHATDGTPARIPAAHRSARYSVEWRCRTRDGTGAPARPRVPRRSAP